MLNKTEAKKLVKIHFKNIVDLFNLNDCTIFVDIYHSRSKKLAKFRKIREGFKYFRFHDLCGCCDVSETNNHQIILFYNKHKDRKHFLSTLIHELLHIKLFRLTNLISKRKNEKAEHIEEDIVRDLESLFIKLLEK